MTQSFPLTLKETTDRILTHISQSQSSETHASLMGGKMGYALFEAYYNQLFGVEDDSRLWKYVSDSLNQVQEDQMIHSFAGGISGVAWAFLHLYNQGLLQEEELDAEGIVEGLDEGLFEVSMLLLKDGDFDYLHGGLSACLYFLERKPSAQVESYVEQIVTQLSEIAVRFPNGDISWKFRNFNQYTLANAPTCNLGLSHGTASIVAVLSLLYERGYARELCKELIEGNLQWMWRVRNKASYSIFPNTVTDEPQEQESRLAWCYGDLGIANTFWLAGEKLQNQTWKDVANQTILNSATRQDENMRIHDAPFCHGAMGASYIFRKFAKRLAKPLLEVTADVWLQKALDFALPKDQKDVFLSYRGEKMGYEPNLSILDGEASIGMVLLSEMGASTAWDRFLLLS
ncbi:MAG: lanthionine synthetase C family protein [Spirosomataceae bacterium]